MQELQKALVEIINTAASAKEFVVQEVPEVVGQLLKWELTISVIQFSFFLLLLCAYLFGSYKYYRKEGLFCQWVEYTNDTYHGEFPYISSAIGQILLIIPLYVFFNLDWLKIWIAPKMYLIEYAADLLK